MRALLSVWDKTGLEAFAKGLVALKYELVSSGGTSRFLAEHDIPHLEVSAVTGRPSDHFASRRWKVQTRPSGLVSQCVAMPGTGEPSGR